MNETGIGSSDVASGDFSISTDGTTTISCTATDAAGNTSRAQTQTVMLDTTAPTGNSASGVTCRYLVPYTILGFFTPKNPKWKHGTTVAIKIALANGDGTRLTNSQAAALAAACRVTFSASGVQSLSAQCMTYNAKTQEFIYSWRLGKPTGSETITAAVSYPGSTATTTTTAAITIT